MSGSACTARGRRTLRQGGRGPSHQARRPRGVKTRGCGAWRALCAAPAAGAPGDSAMQSRAGRGRSLPKDFDERGQTRAARGTLEGQARECSKHRQLRERLPHRRLCPRSACVSPPFLFSPLALSAFLPPSLSASSPSPRNPECSPLRCSGTPLPELPSAREAHLGTSHRSPRSSCPSTSAGVSSLLGLPSSHPCTSLSWGPRLILLSAPLSVPRSSPRSPAAPAGTRGARAFPPGAAVVRWSRGQGRNPSPGRGRWRGRWGASAPYSSAQ